MLRVLLLIVACAVSGTYLSHPQDDLNALHVLDLFFELSSTIANRRHLQSYLKADFFIHKLGSHALSICSARAMHGRERVSRRLKRGCVHSMPHIVRDLHRRHGQRLRLVHPQFVSQQRCLHGVSFEL
jgi:hypothetical protein